MTPEDVTGPVELVVARVGRPHGVRGQVTVEVRTDDPEGRLAPGVVLRTDPADKGPLTVTDARVHGGRLLLAFDGVHDRDAAAALRNALLVVDVAPGERPDDPDEYYDHQLVGLVADDGEGRRLGKVVDVVHLPGQDLLALRTNDGAEALVPFVAAFVPEVDLDGGRVVLTPPAGLLADADDTAERGDR